MSQLAFTTASPVGLSRLWTPRALQRRAVPLVSRRARPRCRATPMAGLKVEVGIAAASALTVGLSWFPLHSLIPDAAMADVASCASNLGPTAELVVSHSTTADTAPTSCAVIGVAKAPIHEYKVTPAAAPVTEAAGRPAPPLATQGQRGTTAVAVDVDVDDARREFVLAARLVTAVLLGVMVGVERRATRLNLGVRSITSITMLSTLVFVVLTCNAGGASTWPALMAVPAVAVGGAAVTAAGAVYVGARMQARAPREVGPMCLVVGLAVGLGGACGAGLSLMTAGCYLGAITLMRATGRGRSEGRATQDGESRELMVKSEQGWDAERRMVLRIGKSMRVVEVGADLEGSEVSY